MSSCDLRLTWSAQLHFKTAWTLFFSHCLFKLFHQQSLADSLHRWHCASSTMYHRRIFLVFSIKFLICFSLAATIMYQNKASLFFTEFQRAFISFHSQDYSIYLTKVLLSITTKYGIPEVITEVSKLFSKYFSQYKPDK